MRSKVRVVEGPVNLGGALGRLVELPDGSGRVETWGGSGWEPGGTDMAAIAKAQSASPEILTEYGVPQEDWPEYILREWHEKQQSKQG